jgi:hypothetical protein
MKTKQTPWSESASELYRPSDNCLSVKLVLTFADRGASRSQRGGSLTTLISIFYTGSATFSFELFLSCTHEAELTSFQTHYSSENLVVPETEPGPLEL